MPDSPGRPNALSTQQVERAVQLLAIGVPQGEIANMFQVSRQTIWRYLKTPEVAEALESWRQTIRVTNLQRLAEGNLAKAYDMAERAMKDGDAKGYDATMRGIAAGEKIAASASGEARKIEVDANVQAQATLDTRALVAAILEHVGDGGRPA